MKIGSYGERAGPTGTVGPPVIDVTVVFPSMLKKAPGRADAAARSRRVKKSVAHAVIDLTAGFHSLADPDRLEGFADGEGDEANPEGHEHIAFGGEVAGDEDQDAADEHHGSDDGDLTDDVHVEFEFVAVHCFSPRV